MHKDLTFCENCRDDVTYVVKDESIDTTLKGEKYTYQGKTAYCSKCGNEVFAGWIHDYNLKSLYDEYRDRHNIVSQDVICAIPKKYAIGKRPLSLLMGWGELTYTRYCDGSVPSKPYSDAIRRVYDDPEYYLHILEENKDILKSQSTYEKSKKAVENILSSNVCDKRKIDYVVDYLISHCEDMTSLSLQKALYYIQGFYYAFNDTFIFSDDCQAWRYGPVYKDVYLNYKDYEFDSLSKIKENDLDIFSADEKAILDSVVKHICCYSGGVLIDFTHSETPWLDARGALPADQPSNNVISKEAIGDYFKRIKEEYRMSNPDDIKIYAQTMFNQL